MPSDRQRAVQLSALGLEFAASVLGGLAAGYAVDQWLGVTPWGVVVGTFAGMVSAMTRIISLSRQFDRRREATKSSGDDALS